ncbi:MAG: hypothetical protein ABEJ05_09505 [Haloglomus sp.]
MILPGGSRTRTDLRPEITVENLLSDGQVVVVGSFLLGLSSAVSALTRLVLGNTDRSAVPVHRTIKAEALTLEVGEEAGDR